METKLHSISRQEPVRSNPFDKSRKTINWAGRFSRFHWAVFIAPTVFYLSMMVVERVYLAENETLAHILNSIFFAFYFSIVGLLIWRLMREDAEKAKIIQSLQAKQDLSLRLSRARDLVQLISLITQQIRSIVPTAYIQTYLWDQNKRGFTRTETLPLFEPARPEDKVDLLQELDPTPCRYCLAQTRPQLHSLNQCKHEGLISSKLTLNGYCLPLAQDNQPVGLILLYMPGRERLNHSEEELLKNTMAEMSGVLAAAIDEKVQMEDFLARKVHTCQLEVARDLHDTVGQNIGYLRMKLDQLSGVSSRIDTEDAAAIQQMSEVANESYDLIRGMLQVLQSSNAADLPRIFKRYADHIASRAGFQITYDIHGSAKPLSITQMRQLFFIFREAISNVENHARASQVFVEIAWEEQNLCLTISDNGVGMDPGQREHLGHYGLKFMKERAAQLNGSYALVSTPGEGTSIVIHVPYRERLRNLAAREN